jgi:hypothetical protein
MKWIVKAEITSNQNIGSLTTKLTVLDSSSFAAWSHS